MVITGYNNNNGDEDETNINNNDDDYPNNNINADNDINLLEPTAILIIMTTIKTMIYGNIINKINNTNDNNKNDLIKK